MKLTLNRLKDSAFWSGGGFSLPKFDIERMRAASGRAEQGFLEYVRLRDSVSFPLSMIDKITPRPEEGVRNMLESLGLEAMYGVDTGLDMTKFKSLADFVAECTRIPLSPTKPIVGDKIFQWETGLPSSLWTNCKDTDPLIMLPYRWEMTGHRMPELLLSKKSGKDNLKVWIEKCGLDIPEEKFGDLLTAVKEDSLAKHKTLTAEEFLAVAKPFTA